MRVSDSKGPRLWKIKIYWQCKPCVLIGLDHFTITFKYWCTNDVKSQRKLKYKTFNRLHLSVQVCSNNAWRTCVHNISHIICLPLVVSFYVVVCCHSCFIRVNVYTLTNRIYLYWVIWSMVYQILPVMINCPRMLRVWYRNNCASIKMWKYDGNKNVKRKNIKADGISTVLFSQKESNCSSQSQLMQT